MVGSLTKIPKFFLEANHHQSDDSKTSQSGVLSKWSFSHLFFLILIYSIRKVRISDALNALGTLLPTDRIWRSSPSLPIGSVISTFSSIGEWDAQVSIKASTMPLRYAHSIEEDGD